MLKIYTVRASDFHTTETQETVEDILFNFSSIRITKYEDGYFQIIAGGIGNQVINLLADYDLLEVHPGKIEDVREMWDKD